MSGYGRAPGTRAGKRYVQIGEHCWIHLSKTGHSPPGVVAPRLKPRRRRATWGPNAFRAAKT